MTGQMPTDVDGRKGFFDRFADGADRFTSRAWFFAACVALVVLWVPSIFVVDSIDTWQLLINTPTTIVTFLLVGLSQNTMRRDSAALQTKLNAIANALSTRLDDRAAQELRAAVGLEERESADDA